MPCFSNAVSRSTPTRRRERHAHADDGAEQVRPQQRRIPHRRCAPVVADEHGLASRPAPSADRRGRLRGGASCIARGFRARRCRRNRACPALPRESRPRPLLPSGAATSTSSRASHGRTAPAARCPEWPRACGLSSSCRVSRTGSVTAMCSFLSQADALGQQLGHLCHGRAGTFAVALSQRLHLRFVGGRAIAGHVVQPRGCQPGAHTRIVRPALLVGHGHHGHAKPVDRALRQRHRRTHRVLLGVTGEGHFDMRDERCGESRRAGAHDLRHDRAAVEDGRHVAVAKGARRAVDVQPARVSRHAALLEHDALALDALHAAQSHDIDGCGATARVRHA